MNGKCGRVLVCDDHIQVRITLENVLNGIAEVVVAKDVPTALNMLKVDLEKKVEDRYTAVIIDLYFEGEGKKGDNADGFQILEAAINDTYIEPIVFTATGNEAKVIRAMELCAFKYIVKNSRTAAPDERKGETIGDVSQVVRAVEQAAERRATLLKLERILAVGTMSQQDGLELMQCLLQLRRPKRPPEPPSGAPD